MNLIESKFQGKEWRKKQSWYLGGKKTNVKNIK